MERILSSPPHPELRHVVRAYAQRQVQDDGSDVQPVIASLEQIPQFEFGDPLTIEYRNGLVARTPKPIAVLNRTPALVVHGDITYEVHGLALVSGGSSVTTTSVAAEFGKLQGLIDQLTSRVAALEAKVK